MKTRFRIIILLMAISLFGIIIVQILWIRHAIKAEEAQFDKSVYSALTSGISQLEKEDMFYFMDARMRLPDPSPFVIDSLMNVYVPEPGQIEIEQIDSLYADDNGSRSQIIIVDTSGGRDVLRIIERSTNSVVWNGSGNVQVDVKFDYPELEDEEEHVKLKHEHEKLKREELAQLSDHEQIIFEENQLDSIREILKNTQKEREAKEFVVREKMKMFNKNMQQWAFEYSFDEEHLLDKGIIENIDNSLQRAFLNNGIELPFNLQIVKENDDTTLIVQASDNENFLLSGQYKTELFPGDFFRKDLYLLVDFPTKSSHIYRSVSFLAFGSFSFTLIILVTFGLTLYYINKQKKISEVKSDFINNMTHEFKTPIATINLAADTMGSPKIAGNADKTNYYLKIIRQENKRMNNQVEKVLQMALIDRQDFQLDFQKTDLHPIIENAVKASELTATEKNGKILTLLRASCSDVLVDEIHFANIVNNLLDNAMKYTEKPPEILVETFNQGSKVILKISDNGIGMAKEVQKHIFDKFYRKTSGNIHNIKGFGLGLSYVQAIVNAHGGSISVSSEPGNGSCFTLSFDC